MPHRPAKGKGGVGADPRHGCSAPGSQASPAPCRRLTNPEGKRPQWVLQGNGVIAVPSTAAVFLFQGLVLPSELPTPRRLQWKGWAGVGHRERHVPCAGGRCSGSDRGRASGKNAAGWYVREAAQKVGAGGQGPTRGEGQRRLRTSSQTGILSGSSDLPC